MFRHKRVAIDFDGTLFEDSGSIDVSYNEKTPLNPMRDAAEVTNWMKAQGFEILVFTCRPDYHRVYLEALLHKAGIIFDYILFYTKPRVDLYIDDKGFRFESWQMTKDWMLQKLSDNGKLKVLSQEPDLEFEQILRSEKIKYLPMERLKSILDVGTGTGTVWEGVNLKNVAVSGVEPDENLRQQASDTGHYREMFLSIDDTAPCNYDCVTILGVLEHVDNPVSFLEAFTSANMIYLTVPNAESFHRHAGLSMGMLDEIHELGPHDHEVGHQRYFCFDTLKTLLEEVCTAHGFKLTMGTTSFKFTSNREMIKFADKVEHYNCAAEKTGLVGENRKFGAEVYALLEKRSG
jgi:hypothetical protein